ncbi:MAG: translation initiation factor IF-2, partial [Methanomassiliicoccaceae archaeon]|nr:translation initiation factor IF-2 [Methanomassiliicoccaceae archaeon]
AASIPIRKYGIGEISRRDIVDAATCGTKLNRVLLGFNVELSKDAAAELEIQGIKVFTNPVVYRLIEEYQEWLDNTKKKQDADKRSEFSFPAKFKILPNCVFHAAKPAIVGVRVLAGRIRPNQRLIMPDGRSVGKIRSIRSGEEVIKEATQGQEVAVAIDDITIGRQANVEDVIYVDLLGSTVREMFKMDITEDERMTLEETVAIKRKEEPFWGM